MDAILIPVKSLEKSKQRLADRLTPEQRIDLGLAMLTDVLAETRGWPARFLVTPDPRASELARSFGVETIFENGEGNLNTALAAGTTHAVAAGVRRLLVLPADVPAVVRADLCTLFDYREAVVVASSADGGTAGMLRSPPDVMATAFGEGSALLHLKAAAVAGLSVRHVRVESLLLDVDDFEDLAHLARMPLGRRSVLLARALCGRESQSPDKEQGAPERGARHGPG